MFKLQNGGGFRVLFTGFILRATKRTLTAAFSWTLFEEVRFLKSSLLIIIICSFSTLTKPINTDEETKKGSQHFMPYSIAE